MTTESISFVAKLERRDYLRVATVLALRNPLSLTAMAAGPVLWLAGTLAGGHMVSDFALRLMFLIVVVPAAALLAGVYAAYRPGNTELFVPVEWEFSDAGVRIRQQGEDRSAEWNDFTGWRPVGGCYLLHTATRRYLVIPKAGIEPALRAQLEALLTGKVGLIR